MADVGFEVDDAEFVAVVGSSADELHLLGDLIAGRARATAGEIVLGDAPITTLSVLDRTAAGLAHVPADRDVFPSLSATDHLCIAREAAGAAADARPALDAGRLFPELTGHLGQRTGSLPPFERRLVAVARAVACRPRILVIDDPTSYVPDDWHDTLFLRCRDLNRVGLAVVVLSTDADRALQLCDRGVVIEGGRVVDRGRGRQVLDRRLGGR